MYFHRILGIKQNASLSDVKRAYAVKIKQHRPDDDPEEFQKIHAAYQSALAYTKSRHADADMTSSASASDKSSWNLIDGCQGQEESDNSEIFDDIPSTLVLADIENHESKKFDRNGDHSYHVGNSCEDQTLKNIDTTDNFSSSTTSATNLDVEYKDWEFAQADNTPEELSGFNFKNFAEEFLDIASNRHATLNSWLENHVDLYDIELKHSLCLPVLEMLDEARPLPPKQLLDLLKFFNMDTVTGVGAEFSYEIENLKNKSANAHPWEDLSFIRAPIEQNTTTESDVPWRIIWFGIVVSFYVIRALS
ncbi:MAG: J domain-containing protein [Arenimonas sp.]